MSIVQMQGICKKYRFLQEEQRPQASFKEMVTNWGKTLWQKKRPYVQEKEFWALSQIHLDVHAGDRIAILGRNGAGKSTLLKILARILEPTEGKVLLNGRVASLLEVGTGFHPDLTGRENIFLQGAIMGLRAHEVRQQLDAIVDFAEIEPFLDLPVKRYSSGMFMRLGFSIAAHAAADLLILDEVLAVGDLIFQEKCLQKVRKMAESGAAVLFVSHQVSSMQTLCNRGIVLEEGRLVQDGPLQESLALYLRSPSFSQREWVGTFQGGVRAKVSLQGGVASDYFSIEETALLVVEWENLDVEFCPIIAVTILNRAKQPLVQSLFDGWRQLPMEKRVGALSLHFRIPCHLFHPGEYLVRLEWQSDSSALTEEVHLPLTLINLDQTASLPSRQCLSLKNPWYIPV